MLQSVCTASKSFNNNGFLKSFHLLCISWQLLAHCNQENMNNARIKKFKQLLGATCAEARKQPKKQIGYIKSFLHSRFAGQQFQNTKLFIFNVFCIFRGWTLALLRRVWRDSSTLKNTKYRLAFYDLEKLVCKSSQCVFLIGCDKRLRLESTWLLQDIAIDAWPLPEKKEFYLLDYELKVFTVWQIFIPCLTFFMGINLGQKILRNLRNFAKVLKFFMLTTKTQLPFSSLYKDYDVFDGLLDWFWTCFIKNTFL